MRVAMALLACLVLRAQIQQPTDARGWLNQGVALFRETKYQEAIDAFERAASLNPDNATIHLYLGTAYMQLWIPGAESAESRAWGSRAEIEFKRVLEINPNNPTALASLTSLLFNEGKPVFTEEKVQKMEQAREWNRRWLDIEPRNRDAHYWAGVIVWSEFYPALMTARAFADMRPEEAGPLPISPRKQELISKYGAMVDEGIEHLHRAIEIDTQYDDAMAYLNLLIRERADLKATPEEYKRDLEEADAWVGRAIQAKKSKAVASQPEVFATSTPAPSPPTPQRIRVDGKVQQANLIHSVDPVCSPLATQARISGMVKFTMIIGKDGKTQNIQILSGHPLLVPAALDAVKQREYRPTLLNGEPVEVITTVDLNMPCGK